MHREAENGENEENEESKADLNSSTYALFKESGSPHYPEKLLLFLEREDVLEHEKNRAEYFLDIWAKEYQDMAPYQKLNFEKYKDEEMLTKIFTIYLAGRSLVKLISVLYHEAYHKWDSLNDYLHSQISKSNKEALNLLWKISFTNFQGIGIEQNLKKLSLFLSSQFEQALRKYQPSSHDENVKLLQTIKHINSHEAQPQFIENGDSWLEKVNRIKEQKLVSQVRGRRKEGKLIEINPFLYVKDEEEEKLFYEEEIRKEILEARELLCSIDKSFWIREVVSFLRRIEARIERMSSESAIDVFSIKILQNLLKNKEMEALVMEEVSEEILLKIKANSSKPDSIFSLDNFSSIPIIFSLIYVNQDSDSSLSMKKIEDRIQKLASDKSDKKQHIVCLLVKCCQIQPFYLKQETLERIRSFLVEANKRKVPVPISVYTVMVKILANSLDSEAIEEINLLPLFKILTEICEGYINTSEVVELRKEIIKLYLEILRKVPFGADADEIIVTYLYRWLQVVELNLKEVYLPMIELLSVIVNKFSEFLLSYDNEILQKILTGTSMKFEVSAKIENVFSFINCLMLHYTKVRMFQAYIIYKDMNLQTLKLQTQILEEQASLIFKVEEEKLRRGREKSMSIIGSIFTKRKNSGQSDIQSKVDEEEVEISKMEVFIGEKDRKRIGELLRNKKEWEKPNIIRLKINLFENLMICAVINSEDAYYIPQKKPNNFIQKLLREFDDDLLELFTYLINSAKIAEMFCFASKWYFLTRNYWFVVTLKSYQFLRERVFDLLTQYFYKNQILFAASFFLSLLLPYIDSPHLPNVYSHLNQYDFAVDLLKGCEEFMSFDKTYNQEIVIILSSFYLVEDQIIKANHSMECFVNILKNLKRWQEEGFPFACSLVEMKEDEAKNQWMNNVVFKINQIKYQHDVNKYYGRLIKQIKGRKGI